MGGGEELSQVKDCHHLLEMCSNGQNDLITHSNINLFCFLISICTILYRSAMLNSVYQKQPKKLNLIP